jgi:hypothetical protein
MNREELLALAERVEALTGPDREVDLEVILASGTHVLERRGRDKKAWLYEAGSDFRRLDPSPYSYGVFGLPRFTASLDAAMSLVSPEWGDWCLSRDSREGYEAAIWACRCRYIASGRDAVCHQGYHATSPALALVAAALRARAEVLS